MSDTKRPKPVVLISMDGLGVAEPGPGNAVTTANTPNLDQLWPKYPHTYLQAAGVHVGLPAGIDGNSEVGHMALGSGKIIFQDLPRIDNAIQSESFFQNPELLKAFEHAKKNNGAMHLICLVGPGKVHSSVDHLYAMIRMASLQKWDADKLFIHAITDGRDSPSDIAAEVLEKVMAECIAKRMGRIASIIGRYYAMDRDERWERTQAAYELYTLGRGAPVTDFHKAIADSYQQGKTDEFLDPISVLLGPDDKPVKINKGDSVVFCNFRPDRAIQLTTTFVDKDFAEFKRELPEDIYFVGMTEYEVGFPEHVAFPPEKIENYLGKVLSDKRLKQLRLAESEKMAHVTYFFNAGNQDVLPGETRIEVPSPKEVSTYDEKPEMSQRLVTDVAVKKIEAEEFDFIMLNFAGPDMVAHTGVFNAAVKSIEVLDECIGRIVTATLAKGGAVIITADHGNAEEMVDLQTGEPDTKHSINPVPVIIIQDGIAARELAIGNLADIAPTILSLLSIEKPAEMTGRDLLA